MHCKLLHALSPVAVTSGVVGVVTRTTTGISLCPVTARQTLTCLALSITVTFSTVNPTVTAGGGAGGGGRGGGGGGRRGGGGGGGGENIMHMD